MRRLCASITSSREVSERRGRDGTLKARSDNGEVGGEWKVAPFRRDMEVLAAADEEGVTPDDTALEVRRGLVAAIITGQCVMRKEQEEEGLSVGGLGLRELGDLVSLVELVSHKDS